MDKNWNHISIKASSRKKTNATDLCDRTLLKSDTKGQ